MTNELTIYFSDNNGQQRINNQVPNGNPYGMPPQEYNIPPQQKNTFNGKVEPTVSPMGQPQQQQQPQPFPSVEAQMMQQQQRMWTPTGPADQLTGRPLYPMGNQAPQGKHHLLILFTVSIFSHAPTAWIWTASPYQQQLQE